MQLRLLLIISVFASEESKPIKRASESNILENNAQNLVLVKIEEDEHTKTKRTYFNGISYNEISAKWRAQRWSKHEKKSVNNGASYKDEETAARASDTLARKLIANGEKGHKLNFPDDDSEVSPETERINYIGVYYQKRNSTWRSCRHSKKENKKVCNGTYKDEETAAHASDTLARKLIANGEKGHKLNFPDDDTEVHHLKEKSSDYIGVSYNKQLATWIAGRHRKQKNTHVSNGSYKDEETAAHASDTLARKLIANGEKGHKLNFPDDDSEVYPKKSSNYIGVSYHKKHEKWCAVRRSKNENKNVYNGTYKDEETAAHASDALARKLIANDEKGHKLNFTDDKFKVHPENETNKRKRPSDFDNSQKCGNFLDKER